MTQKPSIGRIVHYTLSEQDAEAINATREAARNAGHPRSTGHQAHIGNHVVAGEVYPMIITRVWHNGPDDAVNGQVMLDGNDLFWATSVTSGEGERHYAWPERV